MIIRKVFAVIFSSLLIFTSFSFNNYINAETAKSKVVITDDRVNVRENPNTEAKVLSQVNRDEVFIHVSNQDDWYEIKLQDGRLGWVANWVAKLVDEKTDKDQGDSGNKAIITASILNVRKAPSGQGEVIGKLSKTSEVKIIKEENDWFEIEFKDGTGWVNKKFVRELNLKQVDGLGPLPDNLKGLVGTVTASELSVRKKPSFKDKELTQVKRGQHFTIVEENSNWTKIEYEQGKFGWVKSWFLNKTYKNDDDLEIEAEKVSKSEAIVIYDGTSLREEARLDSKVLERVDKNSTYKILSKLGDWYEVELSRKKSAFVAGWLVKTKGPVAEVVREGPEQHLKNKTIVIDPGHGGNDQGTVGQLGTLEKALTLRTSQTLASKLREAGANVILTRNRDKYVSLDSRVQQSNQEQVDAFISIHFDSLENDSSVQGMTSYYYYDFQEPLAKQIHSSTVERTNLKNRKTSYGDYYVLRENLQNAILLELGFLSNPTEEVYLTSNPFQTAAANGIYDGLAKYFKNK